MEVSRCNEKLENPSQGPLKGKALGSWEDNWNRDPMKNEAEWSSPGSSCWITGFFGNGCCAAARKMKSLYLLDVEKVQGSKEVVIGNTVLYCRCSVTMKRKWSRCYLFMPHPDNSLQKNTQDKKKKMRKHTRKKKKNKKKALLGMLSSHAETGQEESRRRKGAVNDIYNYWEGSAIVIDWSK